LADVVAHGGNLLINVGPDGAGRIPDLQQRPLHELGAWLDRNGEAIYATRPWSPAATTTTGGQQVRFTHKDRTVYAIVLGRRPHRRPHHPRPDAPRRQPHPTAQPDHRPGVDPDRRRPADRATRAAIRQARTGPDDHRVLICRR
jgi:hypothetical protein